MNFNNRDNDKRVISSVSCSIRQNEDKGMYKIAKV